jgi:superfamily II DNA/RNA helicase
MLGWVQMAEQVVRTEVVRAFSKGRIDVLVATDVASRGLDLPGLAVVINYDFPPAVGQAALEGYVHRVGRTGRLGQQGVQQGRAFTFIHPDTDAHAAHGLSALLRDAGQPVPRELAELDDGGVMAARGGARAQRKREAESNQSLYQAIERAMQNEEKQKIQLRRERQKKKAEIGGGGGGKNKKRKGRS